MVLVSFFILFYRKATAVAVANVYFLLRLRAASLFFLRLMLGFS